MNIEMGSVAVGVGAAVAVGAVAVTVASKYTEVGKDFNVFRKIRNLEDDGMRGDRQKWWASILEAEKAKAEAEQAIKKEEKASKKAKPPVTA